MNALPTPPRPGDRIGATLVRELIRAVAVRTPIAGSGVRLSCGPNGTVISADPSGKTKKTEDVGCFRIGSIAISEQSGSDSSESSSRTATIAFENCYFSVGGKTYSTGTDAGCEIDEVAAGYIVALKVSAANSYPVATVAKYASMAALSTAQADENYYIVPLYKFGSGFAVECDFRNAPTLAMGEF